MGKSIYHLPDWAYHFRKRMLPKMKFVSVAGAAPDTNIAIAGIKADDVPLVAFNSATKSPIKYGLASATVDCGDLGTGGLDTVIRIVARGADGNNWRLTAKGDSANAAGVAIAVDHTNQHVVVHFEDGVSTVADVETAIAALAEPDDIIAVGTAGTGATVLAATDVGTAMFSGGKADQEELPVVTSAGNIQFANADTAGLTLVIGYFVY